MKVSIITVTYNSALTLQDTIDSVRMQSHSDIEYIVVDGKSKDGTLGIIEANQEVISKWISEADKGIYDAMNRGIKMATGDIVGIINSDDLFHDADVVANVVTAFEDGSIDASIGDVVFVKEENTDRTIRRYSSKKWKPSNFARGYMPAHPSFFAKKTLFESHGYYKTDYKIAADYELMIRFFLVGKINWKYIPITTTKVRMGGASTSGIKSLITLNREILRGCKENRVYSNYLKIYSKYFVKPLEFVFK